MIIIFIIEIHWLEKNKVFSEMSDLKAKKKQITFGWLSNVSTRKEKYINVLQAHIVFVRQVRILLFVYSYS